MTEKQEAISKAISKKAGSTSETLLIVFIVLKLTALIDWSWWWVLSPFWIPLVICFVLLGVIAFIEHGWKPKPAHKN